MAPSVCEGRGVHVGILGGTGPAGRGVAVRLAESGARIVLGSRDAERAIGIAEELRALWPELALDCGFYDQSHLANEFRAFSGISPTTYGAASHQTWANHLRAE